MVDIIRLLCDVVGGGQESKEPPIRLVDGDGGAKADALVNIEIEQCATSIIGLMLCLSLGEKFVVVGAGAAEPLSLVAT